MERERNVIEREGERERERERCKGPFQALKKMGR